MMQNKDLKQQTIVEQIIELVKEMFLNGKLKTGDKLPSEMDLAAHFGVGRNSIRETMKIFQFLGVVDIQGPKGTIVQNPQNITKEALTWTALIKGKEYASIIEFRMVMEQQGVWNLIQLREKNKNRFNEIIHLLEAEIENMKIGIKNNDETIRLQSDYKFHGIIIDFSENNIFHTLYQTLHAVTINEMKIYQDETDQKTSVINRHINLVDALKRDSYQEVSNIFMNHISKLYEYLNNKYQIK